MHLRQWLRPNVGLKQISSFAPVKCTVMNVNDAIQKHSRFNAISNYFPLSFLYFDCLNSDAYCEFVGDGVELSHSSSNLIAHLVSLPISWWGVAMDIWFLWENDCASEWVFPLFDWRELGLVYLFSCADFKKSCFALILICNELCILLTFIAGGMQLWLLN